MSRKRVKVRVPVPGPRGPAWEAAVGPALATLGGLALIGLVWYLCAEWQPWLR